MGCWAAIRTEDNHQYASLPADRKRLVWQKGDVIDVQPDTVRIAVDSKQLQSGRIWIFEFPNLDAAVLQDFLDDVLTGEVVTARRGKKVDLDSLFASLNGGQKNTLTNTNRLTITASTDALLRTFELVRDT